MNEQLQNTTELNKRGRRLPKKAMLIAVILVFVLLCAGAVAYWFISTRMNEPLASGPYSSPNVCDEQTNTKAQAYMNGDGKILDFPNLANTIKQNAEYKNDINCVYILLNYNLSKNISTGNDEYLAAYKNLIKRGAVLSATFTPKKDFATIEYEVSAIKAIDKTQEAADAAAASDEVETLQYVEYYDGQ